MWQLWPGILIGIFIGILLGYIICGLVVMRFLRK